MISLPQIEALVWISQLGSFRRAALRLNATQSAISKRIQELEASLGFDIFDRSQRTARLTARGEEVLLISRKMLALQDDMLSVKTLGEAKQKRIVRFGVTDLTAVTWLPKLIIELENRFPFILPEPEIGIARNLYDKLCHGELDIIACPDVSNDADIKVAKLANVALAWMARPGFIGTDRKLRLEELAAFPLLLQGGRSGPGHYLSKWLKTEGITFEHVRNSDSLMAVIGMTIAGLGVSYQPLQSFQHLIDSHKLALVDTVQRLPDIPYVVMRRQDNQPNFMAALVELMQEVCDYTQHF